MTAGSTGDSDIVIWYAEHYCHGDLLVARRQVARWTATEAHHWLRVAFGDAGRLRYVLDRGPRCSSVPFTGRRVGAEVSAVGRMVSGVENLIGLAQENGLTPKRGDVIRLKYGDTDGALLRVTNEPKVNDKGEFTLEVEQVDV